MNSLIRKFTSELGHNLELHSSAVNHVLNGDLTDRFNRYNGSTHLEKIIKGGLHTYDGWVNFLSYHTDLAHVYHFNSKYHSSWYYARELQNSIITLRIPKHIFSSAGAKITKFPDNYYKSGYLWKTLFQKGFDEQQLISTIEETLNNINREETKDGEIIGYANINQPLNTIRVVIMHRDNKINSVFPSWTQPNTGNNGKAFSHFENIGHVISASTVFFDTKEMSTDSRIEFNNKHRLLKSLVRITPKIFLTRSKPKKNIRKWLLRREQELKAISKTISNEDIVNIFEYINDIEICKNHDSICKHGYNYESHSIEKSLEIFNVFQIHQNIIESLLIIYFYDNKNCSNYFSKSISYLINNMVTHVGIDSWVKRRIYHTIATLLPTYHNIDATKNFINIFSEAPTRREFFVEFSFDSQAKKDIKSTIYKGDIPDEFILVQNPSLSIKVEYNHFMDYLKENLGENYLLHFDDKERNIFASDIINSAGKNQKKLINDIVGYYHSSVFTSFPQCFSALIKHLILNSATNDIKNSIHLIMRDYCRIQFAQRLRINLLYKDYLNMELEDFEPMFSDGSIFSDEYVDFTILRHERILNSFRIEQFLDDIDSLSPIFNDPDFSNEISAYRNKAKREVPPRPEPLPDYIEQRRKG